eukprot:m.14480 g.14480  ORF g.14480 m.14480 type:complete len:56 (+) comp5107_c0_seq1:174-341(+)
MACVCQHVLFGCVVYMLLCLFEQKNRGALCLDSDGHLRYLLTVLSKASRDTSFQG